MLGKCDEHQFVDSIIPVIYYYKVFDITKKYLLDPKGLNKSIQDVLNVFYDVRDDNSFSDAFQNNFGLSLEVFENEYYDRIKEYLTAL